MESKLGNQNAWTNIILHQYFSDFNINVCIRVIIPHTIFLFTKNECFKCFLLFVLLHHNTHLAKIVII